MLHLFDVLKVMRYVIEHRPRGESICGVGRLVLKHGVRSDVLSRVTQLLYETKSPLELC